MPGGLETTLALLAETRNEAALATLIAALDSSDESVRESAFAGLLNRRSPSGHRIVLERWDEWDADWKAKIEQHPGRLTAAIRDSVLNTDPSICGSGCEALLRTREYDLVPALVKAIEERKNPNAALVSETLLDLIELLVVELEEPRANQRKRDPMLVRKNISGCLEAAVDRFGRHQRTVLVEAFLLLAESENAMLKRILLQPRGQLYQTTVELLSDSSRAGIRRLLLCFLKDRAPSKSALTALARRTDVVMVKQFLDAVGTSPSEGVLSNLKRMTHISWVIEQPRLWRQLNDEQLNAAVTVAVTSAMNRDSVFEFLKWVLTKGSVGGRQQAALALEDFRGLEANEVAREAMDDDDPIVLARILMQLRQRGVRVPLTRLMKFADSPHEEVRTAVQKCLGDLSLQRYLSAFELMEEPVRRAIGALVRKVDPALLETMVHDLQSQARSRRIRALQAVPYLGLSHEIEEILIEATQDEDHFVRVEAVFSLGNCTSKNAHYALREALLDSWGSVREAAELTLNQIAHKLHLRADNSYSAPDLESLLDTPLPPELGMEFIQ